MKPAAGQVDSGSATVLTVGLCALLLFATAALATFGAAAAMRHRAQSAADLAALTAADAVLGRRPGEPCALARQVASANGAQLTECVPSADRSVTVRVQVGGTPGALTGPRTASAAARAGPAPSR